MAYDPRTIEKWVPLLEKAAAHMRAAKMRGLEIDSVVDKGANRHARVTFYKREESDMATASDVLKAAKGDPEKIGKASKMILESLAKREQERSPGMSWKTAIERASLSPEYSEVVRTERAMQHGPGY